MKKILSIVMACVLAFAIMLPCAALQKKSAGCLPDKFGAPTTGSVIEFGSWPHTRVTNADELSYIEQKLQEEQNLEWTTETLPNGSILRYADIHFVYDPGNNTGLEIYSFSPTYRVVRVDRGPNQWFVWKPLHWEAIRYQGYSLLVCESIVTAMQNDEDAILTWLAESFYQTAFSAEEQEQCHAVFAPTHGMTNDSTALVGAYAALFGAEEDNYLQLADPDIVPDDPDAPVYSAMPHNCTCCDCDHLTRSTAKSDKKAPAKAAEVKPEKKEKSASVSENAKSPVPSVIGVRPIIVLQSQVKAGGIICCILRFLFGHHH